MSFKWAATILGLDRPNDARSKMADIIVRKKKPMKTPQDHKNAFDYLRMMEFKTPDTGTVTDLFMQHPDNKICVVYDETGELLKMPLYKAIDKYPMHFASMFVGDREFGRIARHVQIGDKQFWLEIESTNDWRATKGMFFTSVIGCENERYNPRIRYPVFCIDYIPFSDHALGGYYAIDFTRDCGLKHMNIHDHLTKKQVVKLLRTFL